MAHFGKVCRGVDWYRWSEDTLRHAVIALGGHALAGILRSLARDYATYSHGSPDLMLWAVKEDEADPQPDRTSPADANDAKGGHYGAGLVEAQSAAALGCANIGQSVGGGSIWSERRFVAVEVKAGADSLRAAQHLWLHRLLELGVECRIAKPIALE